MSLLFDFYSLSCVCVLQFAAWLLRPRSSAYLVVSNVSVSSPFFFDQEAYWRFLFEMDDSGLVCSDSLNVLSKLASPIFPLVRIYEEIFL